MEKVQETLQIQDNVGLGWRKRKLKARRHKHQWNVLKDVGCRKPDPSRRCTFTNVKNSRASVAGEGQRNNTLFQGCDKTAAARKDQVPPTAGKKKKKGG